MRLRHLVTIGPRPPIRTELHPDADVTFVPMEAIANGLGGLDISQTRPFIEVVSGSYNYFAEGDLLLAKVTPCFENGKKALAQSLSNDIGYATSEVHIIRPGVGRIHPKYLFYLLCSEDFRAAGMASMTGAGGLRRVSDAAVLNYRPSVTDLPTQKAIADFLDRETTRIDQLIEKKQRMVEVLEEREENNVVETIEHLFAESRAWKISHVCALKRGRFNQRPRNAPEFYDGDFPFLQTSDVAQAKKYISGHKQTLTDLGASVSVLFPSNSVLMAIAANVGDVAITKFDAYCPDSVIGFIPTTRLRVDYLYYALRSLRSSIATSSTSNAQDNTNISRLGALKIPIPKHATQDRVSRTLSVQENSTVRLIAMTHTSIDRLREFRSALITAAVTGQIDVSTWSKQGTTGRSLDQIEEATSA